MKTFDIKSIMDIQRNGSGWLFLDEVQTLQGEDGKTIALGKKNLTITEIINQDAEVPFFLLGECMEQTFLMTFLEIDELKGKSTLTVGINELSYFRTASIGEQFCTKAVLNKLSRGDAKGLVDGYVNGELIASAKYHVVIPDIMKKMIPNNRKEVAKNE